MTYNLTFCFKISKSVHHPVFLFYLFVLTIWQESNFVPVFVRNLVFMMLNKGLHLPPSELLI